MKNVIRDCLLAISVSMALLSVDAGSAHAQEPVKSASADSGSSEASPLTDDEMEELVARIALYPDELVAVIAAASLYPLQIVQAQRAMDQKKSKSEIVPSSDWDGSVISLLNYPEILKMMNDDLEWTEALGQAVAGQQKEFLEAIQQLRDKAVAQGVLKSDEKTTVTNEAETIVIKPAVANQVYVPVYQPEMLYDPGYPPAPITYYSDSYPSYYYPSAPYFPGFITGIFWGAIIDWNDWGIWGGDSPWGGDIDIDCNNCFNDRNFNGNIKWKDVDWARVDHHKMNFDRSQFAKLDRNELRNGLKANDRNNLRNKAGDLKRNQPAFGQQGNRQTKDVRKSTLEGLQKQGKQAKSRSKEAKSGAANKAKQGAGKKAAQRSSGNKKATRPAGKKKAASRADTRSKKPSPMGDINRGQKSKKYSNRGGRSMGGGYGGYGRGGHGGGPRYYRRPGGGGGFGGGGRGGGGRGGRR